jgi:hypothetical protein
MRFGYLARYDRTFRITLRDLLALIDTDLAAIEQHVRDLLGPPAGSAPPTGASAL